MKERFEVEVESGIWGARRGDQNLIWFTDREHAHAVALSILAALKESDKQVTLADYDC